MATVPRYATPDEVRNGIYYPASDGKKLGEADWHYEAIAHLFFMLREHFAGRNVYVASDLMVYYEEGNPKAVFAPDCMVVLGVPQRSRTSFLVWEEGVVPAVIFEVASQKTYRKDLREKRELYAKLGVLEYYVFDVLGTCFRGPQLQGFQLENNAFVEMTRDPGGGFISPTLNLRFVPELRMLRILDMRTLRQLQTSEEKSAYGEALKIHNSILERETERLKQDAEQRQQRADQKIAEQEKALEAEAQRAETEAQRADIEARRADTEARRAEAEAVLSKELAAEIERLKTLLGERDEAD